MSEAAPDRPPIEARKEFARGSFWMIAVRWVIRGFVSTLILARLLAPDDFGVVAMARWRSRSSKSLRNPRPISHCCARRQRRRVDARDHPGSVLAAVLFTTAPFVGGHFEDPRATDVIRLLSLRAGLLASVILARKPGSANVHDPRLTWNTLESCAPVMAARCSRNRGTRSSSRKMRDEDASRAAR